MSENMIIFLVGQLITAGGIYAAIRADLREHQFRIGALERNCERRQNNEERRGTSCNDCHP